VLLEQLGHDLRDAVSGTARPCALRVPAGAHGRDLVAAFESAAGRAALPVAVVGGDAGRFWPEVEAAVYVCCPEAFPNTANYAGEGTQRG
jgi:hypothetical protein